MLAIKLHRTKKPWLGKGAYLLPIGNWAVGRTHIFRWRHMMDHYASRWPCHNPRYISLVKIPDNHPVSFHRDWGWGEPNYPKQCPLKKVPIEDRKALNKLQFYEEYCGDEKKRLRMELPDMVLGAPLPDKCVKWTKDIRLLYGKDKKRGQSQF